MTPRALCTEIAPETHTKTTRLEDDEGQTAGDHLVGSPHTESDTHTARTRMNPEPQHDLPTPESALATKRATLHASSTTG